MITEQRPPISFGPSPQARALLGMGYGLQHPVFITEVYLSLQGDIDLPQLDEVMQQFIDAPPPAHAPGNPGETLLEQIHYWCAALQRELNLPVQGNCYIRPVALRGSGADTPHYRLVIPYANLQAVQATLKWVVSMFNLQLASEKDAARETRLHGEFEGLREYLRVRGLEGSNTIHFLDAAYSDGIPVTRLLNNVTCFGLGKNSRWLTSSATDRDSAIGVRIAKSKSDSAAILGAHGLPVPQHTQVSGEEDAVKVARSAGYPLVVKPANLDQGQGVFAGLTTEKSLRSAYRAASKLSQSVLVERHYPGEDYRFTVMGPRVIKVMHRQPGGVTGDGKSDISALLREVQATPEHQRAMRRTGKLRLELDQEALEMLEEQGLGPGSVPEAGQRILLRRKSNISTGGTHQLVPVESVHPHNSQLSIRAAQILGLHIAGVDLIMEDATRSWRDTGAVVCEVNAQPQIGFRDTPGIYSEILSSLLEEGGAIPLHLLVVSDEHGPQDAESWLLLAETHGCNGISTPMGVWIDGAQRVWKPKQSYAAARAMLIDRDLQAGLVVMSIRDVLQYGLPAARFSRIGIPERDAGGCQLSDLDELRALVQLHTDQPV